GRRRQGETGSHSWRRLLCTERRGSQTMSVPDGFFCFPTGANRDILASILSGATFMDEAAGDPALLLSAARAGGWHGPETAAQLFRKKTVFPPILLSPKRLALLHTGACGKRRDPKMGRLH